MQKITNFRLGTNFELPFQVVPTFSLPAWGKHLTLYSLIDNFSRLLLIEKKIFGIKEFFGKNVKSLNNVSVR